MYENGGDMKSEESQCKSVNDGSLIKMASDEEGKMFVGGLSWETDEEKLRNYFEQYGAVRDCTIKREQESNRSRGFGFILFADPLSVDNVISKAPHKLDGRQIDPKKAKALRKDTKLFVGGLNPDTTEETIRKHFAQWGEIDSIERPTDRSTGRPRGFCFITFAKDGVIQDVIGHSKFHSIDGRQCECKDGDPKKQGGRGRMQDGNQGGYGQGNYQWPNQSWYGGGGGYPGGYDYNSGYGSYSGGYGGGYGGYGGYGGGYGGYGGYGNFGGYGGYDYSQMQGGGSGGAGAGGGSAAGGGTGASGGNGGGGQQNSGGKAKTAGRGGQNNYKPY